MKNLNKLILTVFALVSTLNTNAQVKVGSNPSTITTNTNLEVEATDGTKIVVKKDNGNVGIGTANPTSKLQITSGITDASGLKFTNLTSSSLKSTGSSLATLAVNSNGEVVTINSGNTNPSQLVVASTPLVFSANAGQDISELSLTLPEAGRYLITFSVRGQTSSSAAPGNTYFSTWLYDKATLATYPGTETMVFFGGPGLVGGTGAKTTIIDVTAPTNIGIFGFAGTFSVTVLSDANGRSTLGYTKL